MKASFEKRLAALDAKVFQSRECDLEKAIRFWAEARVITNDEIAKLIEQAEAKKVAVIPMPPDMAPRLAAAIEVIALEVTGRPMADLASVSARIRKQAIHSLTRPMDRDQEKRLMEQLELKGLTKRDEVPQARVTSGTDPGENVPGGEPPKTAETPRPVVENRSWKEWTPKPAHRNPRSTDQS